MPCSDSRDNEIQADKTAWICHIVSKLEAGERVDFNMIPKARAFQEWWALHKKWDSDCGRPHPEHWSREKKG